MLLAVVILTACHKDEIIVPTPPVPDTTKVVGHRTVLVYMAAENSLSSYSASDISEMMQASRALEDNDRLVIFVDKADRNDKPYLAQVVNGDTVLVKRFASDFYSSDPERMREVIATVDSIFPAEEYGLVLWGHATGWLIDKDSIEQKASASSANKVPRRAYGQDTGSDVVAAFGSKWMNMPQMAKALETLPQRLFIFCDCCCMMSVEVVYELRHCCRYMIGSPAEIPANGAPYHLLVPTLFDKADDFYRGVIDTYYDFYLQSYPSTYPQLNGHSVPLGCVDMQQMEQLAEASRALVIPADSINVDSVAFYFGYETPAMFDMAHYAYHNLPADVVATWRQALDKAVVYRRFSARWMTAYNKQNSGFYKFRDFDSDHFAGLSMSLPLSSYSRFSTYQYREGLLQLQWCYVVGWDKIMRGEW